VTTETIIMSTETKAPKTAPPRAGSLRRSNRVLAFFTIPSLLWYLIFTIGPLIAMFLISFTDWTSIIATPEFIGFENFAEMFNDPRVGTAIVNTAIQLVATVPIQVVGGFMLGYFLSLKFRGHRFFRVVLFIPALISVAQLGTIFTVVFGPAGLINSLLTAVGLEEWTRAWLANESTAMLCIILVGIWSGLGFNSILFAARLSAIDGDVYAAAELDGANHWQRMWRIAFPISIDFFGVVLMLQFLWTLFGSAALILVMTAGGPGQATSTLSWLVYRFAFTGAPSIGYSQAIGVLLFILGSIGLLIIRRAFRQRY